MYDKEKLLANGDRWETEIGRAPRRRRAVSLNGPDRARRRDDRQAFVFYLFAAVLIVERGAW